MSKDELGDRMKHYEGLTSSQKVDRSMPLVVRLDGRAFHTFTKDLVKPIDVRLSTIIETVCAALVREFHAAVAYAQSDEITLVWDTPASDLSQYLFDGKIHKINSVIASFASSIFTRAQIVYLPDKPAIISYDCRAFNVPSVIEVYNMLLWRQQDASRNFISTSAQQLFNNKELHKLSTKDRADLILKDTGVDVYKQSHRLGTFFYRAKEEHITEIGEVTFRTKIVDARTDLSTVRNVLNQKGWNFTLQELVSLIDTESIK